MSRVAATIAALFCAATLYGDRIFVTNERGGTIAVIDSNTDRVIGNIAAPMRPRGIVLSPDRKRLYVAVSHFRDKPSRTRDGVLALDTATLKI
ncbi:MAG TPA: hypothetical protein VJ032_14305, partial [Thermoanaerobaculia bacterium]|nr:hypothetical protein [Thermoanaerobaculia bacterium]